MALPTATPASQRSPQVVGAAFVQQYYHVLHKTPEIVHRFYQDSSILSRPDSDGVMSQVTTLQAISEKVLSFKFNSFIAEIETVDSLASYKEGVFIVVTGCLTASDNVRRKFIQSFFLAPQEKGYFVLNDIFRFVDQSQPSETNQILANGDNDDAPKAPLIAAPEPSLVQENHVQDLPAPALEEDFTNHEETVDSSESCGSGLEEEATVVLPVKHIHSNDQINHEAATSVVQDNGPKKSYASIVKVMGSTPPKKIYVPALKAKPTPPSTDKSLNTSAMPATASEPKAPSSKNGSGPDTNSLDVEGYSIHIRNLPSNSTTELVEEELKKFGPIKPGGVQVRNHKIDNFCYGFVEFELLTSMEAAIKASPISIGGRPSCIEEKRTTTRVVNGVVISNSGYGRGRFPPGRGGMRNDNFRGRGGFGGNNQGYGRTDFWNRGEYLSRGGRNHGSPANVREGYQQWGIQNGNGRMARPNAVVTHIDNGASE